MSKKNKRLQKGIFAGARAARMTPEEFVSSIYEGQSQEKAQVPDSEEMIQNLICLDLYFWDDDKLTLTAEEIQELSLEDVRKESFLERGEMRNGITCRSARLTVGPMADRDYRTNYLTTEPVFQNMSVGNVESFGITYQRDGKPSYVLIRLPWISESGCRVNALETFSRNPDGGATLYINPKEKGGEKNEYT